MRVMIRVDVLPERDHVGALLIPPVGFEDQLEALAEVYQQGLISYLRSELGSMRLQILLVELSFVSFDSFWAEWYLDSRTLVGYRSKHMSGPYSNDKSVVDYARGFEDKLK